MKIQRELFLIFNINQNLSQFSSFEFKITLIESTLPRCVFSAANELPRCSTKTVINYIKYQQIFLDSPSKKCATFTLFLTFS